MSERLVSPVVAVRDRASGRYLAEGAMWTSHVEGALVLDRDEARALVGRFACEPDAVELITAAWAHAAA